MKVLNFGSLNLDYVYTVDHMVTAGETLASEGMNIFCGGKGLNQSIALVKAGVPVYHAGMVGEDGDILLAACKARGVDTSLVRQVPGKSGHTIIQVDQNGQNCILLYGGANRRITTEYVDAVLDNFGSGDILLLQNEVNLGEYIVEVAYAKGMMIIMNPSPFDDTSDQTDFNKISLFLMNEIEGWQITGENRSFRSGIDLRYIKKTNAVYIVFVLFTINSPLLFEVIVKKLCYGQINHCIFVGFVIT